VNNIVFIGFMGSGKSTIGRALAQRLGRPFVELDELITREAGRSVAAIFEEEGEAGFRRRETRWLHRVLSQDQQVVAVGGGAPMAAENWRRMRDRNCVVALTATPETLRTRLNGATDRPLLKGGLDAALTSLLPARLGRYLEADLVITTDQLAPETIAARIATALPQDGLTRIAVTLADAAHEITLGRGLTHLVHPALSKAGVEGAIAIVSDEVVGHLHAPALETALITAGRTAERFLLPSGETAKSLEQVAVLYEFLAEGGVDRQGAIVALGGGVVGDVAGFVAATWLRGVPYLQMPTTLLAMVDSSIGGKTGINLAAGKNLIGSIYQPVMILSDLAYLDTLPEREFRAAWAEIIKSAIIGDASLFEHLRSRRTSLMAKDAALLPDVIARACAFKAQVVSDDPLERGRRAILNYGHTGGHALEAAAGYGALLHGEAIAWGMMVAGRLSLRLGLCDRAAVDAQDDLLREYGLFVPIPPVPRSRLKEAMLHDKKARGGELRWVLLRDIGQVECGCRVPEADVEAALDDVLAG